jgi:hypothetical protein
MGSQEKIEFYGGPRKEKRREEKRREEVEGVKRVYEVWAAHSKLEEWAT